MPNADGDNIGSSLARGPNGAGFKRFLSLSAQPGGDHADEPCLPPASSWHILNILSTSRRCRPRRLDTLVVGFACMLALITAMGLQIHPFTYLWVSLYTGVAVAVLAVSLTVRLEKKYLGEREATLAAKRDLQRLSARLVASQEQERQMLSSQLHDQVGKALTDIKNRVARAEQVLFPSQSELIEELRCARQGAEETLEIIRRLSMLLRPSMLDDLGLSAALGWYAKQFSASTSIRVSLNDDGSADQLLNANRTSLYRIVQEALTNCARHSEAQSVLIKLGIEDHRYIVHIEDDGKGFVPAHEARGIGLIGMEERVAEMGGSLNLNSVPGAGTKILISIPLR
jgi:signal transduction histidine kinase